MLDALSRLFDVDPVWPGPPAGGEDAEELRRWRELRKGGRNRLDVGIREARTHTITPKEWSVGKLAFQV